MIKHLCSDKKFLSPRKIIHRQPRSICRP